MTMLSCGPLWKGNNKWENVWLFIFFPRLAHMVNQRVRRGAKPPLCCADCVARGVTRGLRGAGNPLYGVWGSALENFGFGTYVRLGGPTYGFVHDFRTCFWARWFSVHGFGCNGFQSMVLDVLTCINMYYNIERNIMKNQAGSPSFGIQGKISVYMCFMCYTLALFILYVLEFLCR